MEVKACATGNPELFVANRANRAIVTASRVIMAEDATLDQGFYKWIRIHYGRRIRIRPPITEY